MTAPLTSLDSTASVSGPARGRPPSADKRRAIRDAAAALFLSRGFDRTSMDEVAARAGVSKQTVYAHFASKEGLFRACIADKVAEYFPDEIVRPAASAPLGQALFHVGRQYARLILSDEAASLFRTLAAGGASSHPHIVQSFFEEGPARLFTAIEPVVADAVRRGRLACADTMQATRTFCTLLRGDLFLQRVLGLLGPMGESDIDAHVSTSVEAFLRIYEPRSGATICGATRGWER